MHRTRRLATAVLFSLPASAAAAGSIELRPALTIKLGGAPAGIALADFDGAGIVGINDLLALLAAWGPRA